VQKLREKEEAALRTLMEQYGDELLRTAYLLLKDRHAAEEAVQDTFITAYAKIGQLRDDTKLRGWLIRIAVNRCRMKRRSWSWRNLLPFPRVEDLVPEDHEPGPEERALGEWRSGSLTRAIGQLDYKYREAITLYYYAEMSIREIAEQTGTNENTVKARLSRGRAQLKEQLEQGGIHT